MILMEAILAAAVGLAVVWMVLQPLVQPAPRRLASAEPPELEDTQRGRALLALKEIEFDRETGKLSDVDHSALKTKYTAIALHAMRAETATRPAAPMDIEAVIAKRVQQIRASGADAPGPVCANCGPRPESDAAFCSSCGVSLGLTAACSRCGAPVEPGGRYCAGCGTQVAA